jgi:8-oxo-dGTP pyrophosphatase MutT (NUDIX family)
MREKALVWIVRPGANGPEVLLFERPARRGGGLHPVTGKGEAGEAPEVTAAREAREESGLEGTLVPLDFSHVYEDARRGQMREHAFLLRAPERAEPKLSEEHVDCKWVPALEVDAMLEWPAHRQSLRLALILYSRQPKRPELWRAKIVTDEQ